MLNFSKSKTAKVALGFVAFAFALMGAKSALASFDSNLKMGMRSASVKELQMYLNSNGFTVATSGAGSVGNESTYFGAKTKAAVQAFQSAKGISPVSGFVGPLTRAVLNSGGSTTPGTTPTAGPLTVSLAADTPSGTYLASTSGTTFAKFNFSGNGVVTSVKLTRNGISSSTTASNVYLYDGSTRLTDGASISSDNTVVFNSLSGLFTVAGTKTISVVADIGATADYSLGFTLSSYTAGSTATTVSVKGNELLGASASLATVTMSGATGSGATDAGVDVLVWQGTATVDTRDVLLKSLALRQIGSITSGDIRNFKLYVDGVLVTTVASLDSNGYVTFASPIALRTGARTLKVTADVIGGSGRTVQMSLRGAYDMLATDTQYNANKAVAGTFPFGPSAFTVNTGSLTVVKATDSPSSNVTLGASDQSLAKYTFTAYGEPIKVETLKVGMITTGGTVTDNTLRNVRILVNGAQVGSNTSVPAAASFAAASGTSFTTNFVVTPGTPATVEIHADIFDNEGTDDIAAGTTTAVQALLVGGTATSNAIPQVSLGTINVPSATNVLGNNLTISSGSMSLTKTSNYANQTIAVPVTAYKVGSFQLSGNATEPVNLNTIYVGFADTASDAAPATDLSDLYVVYGGTQTTVKGTVACTYSSGCDNANSWSINKTLAKNETLTFDVYATIASSLSTNSFITTLAVAGVTANSGITTYADASGTTSLTAGVSGQEITGGTGSITATTDASTPVAQLVDDSGSIVSATFKFAAVTDSYTVTDMTFTLGNASAVSTVTVKDHDTHAVIGAARAAGTTLTWNGLSLSVPANTSKLVDVELALSSVGVGAGTTDSSLLTTLTAFTARNSGGTSAAGTESNPAGNAMYVYKAVPTLTAVTLPNSTLAGGEMVIAKFTVSTSGTGTIAWKQAMFEITKSAAPTLSAATLWNTDTGLQVTAASVYQNGTSGVATTCVADNTFCELLITVGTNADDDTVEQVSGAKTYEIRSTIGGTLASGNSVAVKLDRNTVAHAASAAEQTNDNSLAAGNVSFVWSDESASATADTGVATWQKDYLVKNAPLNWALNRN